MKRFALVALACLSLTACAPQGIDTGDAKKVEAITGDGSEILLLCSEDPITAAQTMSEKTRVKYSAIEGENTFLFEKPMRVDDEFQRIVVSGLETEPCKSGVKRQNSVDAANFGLGVVGAVVLLPIMILTGPAYSY